MILIPLLSASPVLAVSSNEYVPVPGLMDLRTAFSNGAHSPERCPSRDLDWRTIPKKNSIPVNRA